PSPKSVALIADPTGKFSGLFPLPINTRTLFSTGLFSLKEKLEFAKFYARIAKIPAQSANSTSVRQWVEQNVKHERVREMVYALFRVTTYTNDPEIMSAGVGLAQIQLALREGVYYLNQGWQTLVDGLRNAAEASGVNILSSWCVESIELNGWLKRVHLKSVVPGAEELIVLEASDVVLAVSPDEIRRIMPEIDQTLLPDRPVRAATLDLALEGLPNPNIQFALGINRPLYFSVHSDW